MADTKVTYKEDKGFWIHEIFLQLILHYISSEISNPQHNIPNKVELIDDLNNDIQGYTSGHMCIGLFEYTNSLTEEQTMISVLQNVKTTLQNKGAFISVNELQAIPTDDWDFKVYYRKQFPTSELIKIIDALIQMLQGTWTSTNYDMKINYK